MSERVGDCCLTPSKFSAIYHCENKLIFNQMLMSSALLDFYSANSLNLNKGVDLVKSGYH